MLTTQNQRHSIVDSEIGNALDLIFCVFLDFTDVPENCWNSRKQKQTTHGKLIWTSRCSWMCFANFINQRIITQINTWNFDSTSRCCFACFVNFEKIYRTLINSGKTTTLHNARALQIPESKTLCQHCKMQGRYQFLHQKMWMPLTFGCQHCKMQGPEQCLCRKMRIPLTFGCRHCKAQGH
jgi:hypothetical protein